MLVSRNIWSLDFNLQQTYEKGSSKSSCNGQGAGGKEAAHVLYLLCFKDDGIILLSGYFYVKEKEGWHVYDRLYKMLKETLNNYWYLFGFVRVFKKDGVCVRKEKQESQYQPHQW